MQRNRETRLVTTKNKQVSQTQGLSRTQRQRRREKNTNLCAQVQTPQRCSIAREDRPL